MANSGLVVSGSIITAFALALLNPVFEIPDLEGLTDEIPVNSSLEWAVIAVVIFVVVFLTGSSMIAKGFLERKAAKSVPLRELEAEAA
jgi:hypothetical protein